jgi:RNA polymerase sigma-70 factor (ECF subfamily)
MSAGNKKQQLIDKAVSGDRAAREELLVGYGSRLSSYFSQRLPSTLRDFLSADDLLQETYVQAIQGISEFEGITEPSVWAWLKTIAENQIRNALKAQHAKKRGGDRQRAARPVDAHSSSLVELVEMLADGDPTPGRAAMRVEAIHAVQLAIAGLPEEQRKAIMLHYLGGDTVVETAVQLGCTPGAVRALIGRARQKLRHALRRSSLWLSNK